MVRAALRRAICGNVAEKKGDTCLLFGGYAATYGPYKPQLDGPFRQAKNSPSQMRRPASSPSLTVSTPNTIHHSRRLTVCLPGSLYLDPSAYQFVLVKR